VRGILGDAPRRREFLIENLHHLQDSVGHLPAAHLAALAHEMRLSQAEVHEVATFYAHFDVIREGEQTPPPRTVRVCAGLSCEMAGARELFENLKAAAGSAVRVHRAPCMGGCEQAPFACAGKRRLGHATPDLLQSILSTGETEPKIPAYADLDAYRQDGGYEALTACRSGKQTREEMIRRVEAAGLQGLGGAGFPAARKWRIVAAEPGPRTVVINADEGEPGTFKDRFCLDTDPHRVLEGALIAAWAVEAEDIYLYLRDEYPGIREILLREIPKIEAAGLTAGVRLHLRRGAGAYVCGEESALLESLEGKRGLPRNRPPYPAQHGLFARPTLIHNVETLYWLREIFDNGAEWFRSQGRNGASGLRLYSVSGRVRNPGVKRAGAGITARELIEFHCGGMAAGHTFKGYLPGGASGGILPAALADLPLHFNALWKHGSFVGSGAVIVLSDTDNAAAVTRNLLRFFANESCGQCTPCRLGTEKAVRLLEAEHWDKSLLDDLGKVMTAASICGLGQAAPNPIRSTFRHFPEDVP
jgi:formate dehydrogenase